ncbi:hypothetical protein NHX12_003880, partial [Muraenolepis orangiensis]
MSGICQRPGSVSQDSGSEEDRCSEPSVRGEQPSHSPSDHTKSTTGHTLTRLEESGGGGTRMRRGRTGGGVQEEMYRVCAGGGGAGGVQQEAEGDPFGSLSADISWARHSRGPERKWPGQIRILLLGFVLRTKNSLASFHPMSKALQATIPFRSLSEGEPGRRHTCLTQPGAALGSAPPSEVTLSEQRVQTEQLELTSPAFWDLTDTLRSSENAFLVITLRTGRRDGLPTHGWFK